MLWFPYYFSSVYNLRTIKHNAFTYFFIASQWLMYIRLYVCSAGSCAVKVLMVQNWCTYSAVIDTPLQMSIGGEKQPEKCILSDQLNLITLDNGMLLLLHSYIFPNLEIVHHRKSLQ